MRRTSDIEEGRVIYNWQITAVVMVGIVLSFALVLGRPWYAGIFGGLVSVGVWIGWELHVMNQVDGDSE